MAISINMPTRVGEITGGPTLDEELSANHYLLREAESVFSMDEPLGRLSNTKLSSLNTCTMKNNKGTQ